MVKRYHAWLQTRCSGFEPLRARIMLKKSKKKTSAVALGSKCVRCGADEWYPYRNRQCAPCTRKHQGLRKSRPCRLRDVHGITEQDYEAMLLAQHGVCAICGQRPIRRVCGRSQTGLLDIDHCHKTQQIRGLLCNKCNRAIGLFQDSVEALRSAVRYLEQASPR